MRDLMTMNLTDTNRRLIECAKNNDLEGMEKAKNEGADEYELALKYAAATGQLDAMRLAVKWGARDYCWAIACAANEGQSDSIKLLKDFIDENNEGEL